MECDSPEDTSGRSLHTPVFSSPDTSSSLEDTLDRNISSIISSLESPASSDSSRKKSEVLTGIKAYVEVRSGSDNRSNAVSNELLLLGAEVAPTLTKDVTHVVFKSGKKSTLDKARKWGIHVVSVLWMGQCRQTGTKVSEDLFPPTVVERSNSPHHKMLNLKRYKFLQSKDLDKTDSRDRPKKRSKKDADKEPYQPPFKLLDIPGITCQTPEFRPPFYVENTVFKATKAFMSPLPPVPETPASMKKKMEELQKRKEGSSPSGDSTDEEVIEDETAADGFPLSRRLFDGLVGSRSGSICDSSASAKPTMCNVDCDTSTHEAAQNQMCSNKSSGKSSTLSEEDTSPQVPIVQASLMENISNRSGKTSVVSDNVQLNGCVQHKKGKKRKLLASLEDDGLVFSASPSKVAREAEGMQDIGADALFTSVEMDEANRKRPIKRIQNRQSGTANQIAMHKKGKRVSFANGEGLVDVQTTEHKETLNNGIGRRRSGRLQGKQGVIGEVVQGNGQHTKSGDKPSSSSITNGHDSGIHEHEWSLALSVSTDSSLNETSVFSVVGDVRVEGSILSQTYENCPKVTDKLSRIQGSSVHVQANSNHLEVPTKKSGRNNKKITATGSLEKSQTVNDLVRPRKSMDDFNMPEGASLPSTEASKSLKPKVSTKQACLEKTGSKLKEHSTKYKEKLTQKNLASEISMNDGSSCHHEKSPKSHRSLVMTSCHYQ